MPIEKYVAIIGGGIGGLSAAFFLQNRLSAGGQYIYKCAVFEKSKRFGGNADTAYLGEERYQKPFADLGVNDFNLNTYRIMVEVLKQLEVEGFKVDYGKLLPTTNFSTSRQAKPPHFSYTDYEMKHPTDFPHKKYLQDVHDGWKHFEERAYKVMHDPTYRNMSVGEFLREPGFNDNFRDLNILPRINGMYFMDDGLPQDMPILGVMSYYHLQEGVGDKTAPDPDRQYFKKGASDWINQLVGALKKRGVKMYLDDAPTVIPRSPTELHVLSRHSSRLSWDYVISAVYADQVPNVIVAGLPPMMPTLLAQFRYFTSISIVHEYEDAMPPEQEQWRTYNILIHQEQARMLRPYTIAYVCKMHQGEDKAEPPFVSLSPSVPIPDGDILEMIDMDTGEMVKAVAYLRHNLVSVDTLAAQRMMDAFQGHNNIYFTGGWTKGAGLHEETLSTSLDIANRIRGYFVIGQSHSYSDMDPEYTPKYIRDSFVKGPVEVLSDGFWD